MKKTKKKMHPTKTESVNNLVEEEPKEDYQNINLTWMKTYLKIKPIKKKVIWAKFIIPVGYDKEILLRMVYTSWKATKLQPQLKTALEKGKFWQKHLQNHISINREFMS